MWTVMMLDMIFLKQIPARFPAIHNAKLSCVGSIGSEPQLSECFWETKNKGILEILASILDLRKGLEMN